MIRSTILACALICSAAAISTALAAGPSFNCATAKLPDELAICSSDELSSLERTMVSDLNYAMGIGDAPYLRKLAAENLHKRRACKSDVACVRCNLVAASAMYHDAVMPDCNLATSIMDAGSLGASVTDVSADVAAKLGVQPAGALIVSVSQQGAAQAAGIQNEDVILKFNGEDISNAQGLVSSVQKSPTRFYMPVVISRGGDQGIKLVKLP
jgi:uncharacterized protein